MGQDFSKHFGFGILIFFRNSILHLQGLEGVVDKDEKKAFDFFQRSSDLGNLDALYNLSLVYKQGIGVPVDQMKSFELLKEAAEKGKLDCLYEVGSSYSQGVGVEKDDKKAFVRTRPFPPKNFYF